MKYMAARVRCLRPKYASRILRCCRRSLRCRLKDAQAHYGGLADSSSGTGAKLLRECLEEGTESCNAGAASGEGVVSGSGNQAKLGRPLKASGLVFTETRSSVQVAQGVDEV